MKRMKFSIVVHALQIELEISANYGHLFKYMIFRIFICIIKITLQTLQTLVFFYPWILIFQDCTFYRLCQGKHSFEDRPSEKSCPESLNSFYQVLDKKNAGLMSTGNKSPSWRTLFCSTNSKRHNKMVTFLYLDRYTNLTRLLPWTSVEWTILKMSKIYPEDFREVGHGEKIARNTRRRRKFTQTTIFTSREMKSWNWYLNHTFIANALRMYVC